MAITYPLTLPVSRYPAEISVRPVFANAQTVSPFSYASQQVRHTGFRWEAELTLPPMPLETARDWLGWIVSLQGNYGTFTMIDPLASWGGTATAPTLSGAHSARATTLTLAGAGNGGTFKRGDQIEIVTSSTSRLHMICADATADGAGAATVDIQPGLRAAVAGATAVGITSPKGTYRLSRNDVGWVSMDRFKRRIVIPCEEAL